MNDRCVWAKIPYAVDYHVPRGRKLRKKIVWEETPLSFRAPTVDEAPIAYRITQTDSKNDARPDYDIRTHDGQLWWPVLDSANAWRTAEEFLNGLVRGDYFALEILHPSLARYWSPSKLKYDEVFRDIKVRGAPQTSRDETLAFAQRGASEAMACDGLLYVQAGEPMYFAFPSQWHGGRQITLEAGASPWRGFFGYGSRLPGPRVEERRHALSEANIFDLHYLDDELATFKD